jgi:hypothetical protein
VVSNDQNEYLIDGAEISSWGVLLGEAGRRRRGRGTEIQ